MQWPFFGDPEAFAARSGRDEVCAETAGARPAANMSSNNRRRFTRE